MGRRGSASQHQGSSGMPGLMALVTCSHAWSLILLINLLA